VPVYDLAAAGKRVTNGTDLERSGLLLFAGAVVAAGMVIIGQALTRSVRAAGADVPTLVALGFSRRDAAYALALPHVVSAVVAAVVTLGLAVALSPRFPIGLGRRVDPDVGLHVDVPVVVGGAALVVAALGGSVAWSAWRAAAAVGESSWTARSGVASMLLRVGAPVPTSIGAGLALEPGRGQRALPTRPALVGAATGVLGIIGASTLGAGIDDASRHPERFGAVWDVEVTVPDVPDEAFRSAPDSLAADPDVAAVARVARLTVPVGDLVLPFYALDEIEGSMDFALLGGRPPQSPDEVVLGPDSAETLGVGVGDEIEVGDGGAFRVVGLGLLPTTAHSSFDQGGWLMPDGLARSVTDTQRHAIAEDMGTDHAPTDAELSRDMFHFFGGVFARFHGGVDERAAIARLAGQIGDTVTVAPPSEPADQLNLRNVRPLPFLFAGFSLALAVAALAHISATVLRRRRGELAVLRSLGMTPLQVRACLGWQATTLAAVGLVVGVPLGMALGRLAWRAVADATPMIYVAPLAVLALALAVPVALTVANLVAALPGQRAARLRPAEVLRTE
jgi:hypothetical protein